MSGQKKRKQSFADILGSTLEDGARRVYAKVPEWGGTEGLSFPTSLCTEQCSSSATAWYKAALARRIMGKEGDIADLTGGLGVDSWAFSHVAGKVLHNEMNRELHDAAKANLAALGRTNITTTCAMLETGTLDSILEGFVPDLLYLDPARRNSEGRKVFLLEDCNPDIIGLKDELLDACGDVLVKISPMADITMAARRLGRELREVHITGNGGECKELLLWLSRDNTSPYSVTVAECLGRDNAPTFTFLPEEEASSRPSFLTSGEELASMHLFEPGSALTKSGCHGLLSQRFGMRKLGRFTHLYACREVPAELCPLGKVRPIREIIPFCNKNIRELGKRFPHCEVSARNIPLSSDALRTKMGAASGNDAHIYGVTLDFETGDSERVLIVTGC